MQQGSKALEAETADLHLKWRMFSHMKKAFVPITDLQTV